MARIYTPDMTMDELNYLQQLYAGNIGGSLSSPQAMLTMQTGMAIRAFQNAVQIDKQNFPNGGEPRFDKDMNYNSSIFYCLENEIGKNLDNNGNIIDEDLKSEMLIAENLKRSIKFVMDVTDMSNEQVLELFLGEPLGPNNQFLSSKSSQMSKKLAMVWVNDGKLDYEDLLCTLANVVPHATHKPDLTDNYKRVQEMFSYIGDISDPQTYGEAVKVISKELEYWPFGKEYRDQNYVKTEKFSTSKGQIIVTPLPKPTEPNPKEVPELGM